MFGMHRSHRTRKRRIAARARVQWLDRNGDPSFKAGLIMLWALLFLVAAALTLDWLLRADKFLTENVEFEGRFEHVNKQQLVESVKNHVRGNFFVLDLDAIKAKVESLPWVYRASVRRKWPRDLHIHFSEQRFVARWGHDGWLNDVGELVKLGDLSIELPRLSGPEGTHALVLARYQIINDILEPINLQPIAVTLTSRRTWRVQLNNGVVLILERHDPDTKVERFARVYKRVLAHYADRVRQVDLRYTNGFSVEWIDPPAQLARVILTHGQ